MCLICEVKSLPAKYGWLVRVCCQHKITWIMQVGVKCERMLGKWYFVYQLKRIVKVC